MFDVSTYVCYINRNIKKNLNKGLKEKNQLNSHGEINNKIFE